MKLSRRWLDQYPEHVDEVLRQLKRWSPEAKIQAQAVLLSMPDEFQFVRLLEAIAAHDPDDAADLLADKLAVLLTEAQEKSAKSKEPWPRDVEHLLDAHWRELEKLISQKPEPFSRVLWAFLQQALPKISRDRGHSSFPRASLLGWHSLGWAQLLRRGFSAWSTLAPDSFLTFAQENADLPEAAFHQLQASLIFGYQACAEKRPRSSADFLLKDPRRFSLGSDDDTHQYSINLIMAASSADVGVAADIAKFVAQWRLPRQQARADEINLSPNRRLENFRWRHQEHQQIKYLMLDAIPNEFLEQADLASQRAFKALKRRFGEMGRPFIIRMSDEGSTAGMTAKGIIAAGPLNFRAHLDAETRRDRRFWSNLSSVLREAVGLKPEIGLKTLQVLRNDELEYVSTVLRALPQQQLIQAVDWLDAAGWTSEDHRTLYASCLAATASTDGLPDHTIEMLSRWLTETINTPPTADRDPQPSENPSNSPDHRAPVVLKGPPQTNSEPQRTGATYEFASAIISGLSPRGEIGRRRLSNMLLRWSTHRGFTWDAWWQLLTLQSALDWIAPRQRAQGAARLRERLSAELASPLGAWVFGRTLKWVQAPEREAWMLLLAESPDPRVRQGYGELLGLLWRSPSEVAWVANQFEAVMGTEAAEPERDGIGFALLHQWGATTGSRPEFGRALVRILKTADASRPRLVSDFFFHKNMIDAPEITDFLKAVADNLPELMPDRGIHLQALQKLVAYQPHEVAAILETMIEREAPQFDTSATLSIVLALHRMHGFREVGLRLFNLLVNTPAANRFIKELDSARDDFPTQ